MSGPEEERLEDLVEAISEDKISDFFQESVTLTRFVESSAHAEIVNFLFFWMKKRDEIYLQKWKKVKNRIY